MFSIKNDRSEVAFLFSQTLKNTKGMEMSARILSKRDTSCYENLEIDVRRSVFPELPRGQMERFSLKLYRKLYGLSKKQMRSYRVEIFENWRFLDSEFDLTKVYVQKVESSIEKVDKCDYIGHITYHPYFKRNMQ